MYIIIIILYNIINIQQKDINSDVCVSINDNIDFFIWCSFSKNIIKKYYILLISLISNFTDLPMHIYFYILIKKCIYSFGDFLNTTRIDTI